MMPPAPRMAEATTSTDAVPGRTGLYSLRHADRSVRIGALLFMLLLGYGYIFAFLMVRQYAGLTPAGIRDTFVPTTLDEAALPEESSSRSLPLNFDEMQQTQDMTHRIDTQLLIQDSHVHLLMFAVLAGFQTLIVLGLGWPAWWRDTVIVAAFGSAALDFSGQWLMKAGLGGFAWLTLVSGWTMMTIYVAILVGTFRAAFGSNKAQGG